MSLLKLSFAVQFFELCFTLLFVSCTLIGFSFQALLQCCVRFFAHLLGLFKSFFLLFLILCFCCLRRQFGNSLFELDLISHCLFRLTLKCFLLGFCLACCFNSSSFLVFDGLGFSSSLRLSLLGF